ncbi:hypothetical protein EDD22DRAFT_849237 [Suillus occidentalis]|nr:hypothetical protein EDD22DRAFT_849237 [Suillus occidentalis]
MYMMNGSSKVEMRVSNTFSNLKVESLTLCILQRTTPAIFVPRKIGPVRLIWTEGSATPVYLAPGAPPRRSNVSLHLWEPLSNTSESHGRSKTTAWKTPAPAPASITAAVLSSSYAVPCAALNVPMLDLHSMAIAIRDGAAHIAILEPCVWEQDGKIDTLQCLHESLRRQVVDQHPSFPLPDSPANATFLLDQSIPPLFMSPLPSALPNLINLDMGVMEPTPLKVEDASDMVGLMFEPSQVQPEGPQSSSEIVDPDDPGNLFSKYNSVSEEMDIEVKAGTSGEEVEMAT